MQELPYDVWQQIGQHLPYNSLKQNMSLNRAFFHLLMKSRYKVVVISHRDAKDCIQTMDQKRIYDLYDATEPMRGAHIEDLTLEIHPRAIQALGLQFDAFLNKTLQALDAMHSLSALHLISQSYSDNLYGSRYPGKDNVDDSNIQLRAFFCSMWKNIGATQYLKELMLQGTPSYLQLVLQEPSLPALKRLDILLYSKKNAVLNADETSYHLLISFMNGLAEHLERLTIDSLIYTNDMIGLVFPHLNLNLKYINLQLQDIDSIEHAAMARQFTTRLGQASSFKPLLLKLDLCFPHDSVNDFHGEILSLPFSTGTEDQSFQDGVNLFALD